MAIKISWYLPLEGDGRTILKGPADDLSYPGAAARRRRPSVAYLTQVALAADELGFDSLLTATGRSGDDPWVFCSALVQMTQRIKFLVAFRAGLTSPTLLAQMAASFQRVSGGRLNLNVVSGADGPDQSFYSDYLTKDQRYARTDEFLRILTRVWDGEPFSYEGVYYSVKDAALVDSPARPGIYFGGASASALPIARRHADVYLMFGEPPGKVAERIDALRAAVPAGPSMPRLGLRFHVVTRPDSAEAWGAAERLLAGVDDDVISAARADLAEGGATGELQMARLADNRENLQVYPNLWAGVGLARRGAGTALVGSYDEVAERIAEYHELGVDTFILSGYPHLEEAYHVGEGVMPRLRAEGLLR